MSESGQEFGIVPKIEVLESSEKPENLMPETEVKGRFAASLVFLYEALQTDDPSTRPDIFRPIWSTAAGDSEALQKAEVDINVLANTRGSILGMTGALKEAQPTSLIKNSDNPHSYNWQLANGEQGQTSLGQLRLGLEIIEETGIDAQQRQQAKTARQALEQCMYDGQNRPYAQTRLEVEKKAQEVLGVDDEGWQTTAPEKKLAAIAQAEQDLGLEYKLRGLKETSTEKPATEKSLTEEIKEKAEWNAAQIKAIGQLVASLNLTETEKLKAGVVFDEATRAETPPTLTQVLGQLEAIGIQPGQKLPKEADKLTSDQKLALQAIIDSSPGLQEQGINTAGLHTALLEMAMSADKRREMEAKTTKADKRSWIYMAIYYVLLSLGGLAEKTEKAIQETEAVRQ